MHFIKWLYHNLFCGITLMNILIAKYFGNMGKWKTLCVYTCANKFQYRSLEFKWLYFNGFSQISLKAYLSIYIPTNSTSIFLKVFLWPKILLFSFVLSDYIWIWGTFPFFTSSLYILWILCTFLCLFFFLLFTASYLFVWVIYSGYSLFGNYIKNILYILYI